MGVALTQAALDIGHEVVVISGPVSIPYPTGADVVKVVSTDDMLVAAREAFQTSDGLIGAAAPCDYQPIKVASQKIAKTGDPLKLHLVETADIVATLGETKRPDQWVVGFALETEDQRFRALAKMEKKSCDLMVLNGPAAMNSLENQVEVLDSDGAVVDSLLGTKTTVAEGILQIIENRLIRQP